MVDVDLSAALRAVIRRAGRVIALTGAGISAESGIPTFRGPEGYWTIGSQSYHPQQMATQAMFRQKPAEVWAWYLHRRGVCCRAEPNAGHKALVDIERRRADRFTLITQNVDGLHLRAGNSAERTFQIHGNINFMRCAAACTSAVFPLPDFTPAQSAGDPLTHFIREALRCPVCGGWARPHVLWFDECYNEEFYRLESSLAEAARANLLIVVGTSGATNLPQQVAQTVARRGGVIIDVNVQEDPFAELARASGGYYLAYPSGMILPLLAELFA